MMPSGTAGDILVQESSVSAVDSRGGAGHGEPWRDSRDTGETGGTHDLISRTVGERRVTV